MIFSLENAHARRHAVYLERRVHADALAERAAVVAVGMDKKGRRPDGVGVFERRMPPDFVVIVPSIGANLVLIKIVANIGGIGFRYPVVLNGKDANGFYLGAFAGHLRSVPINGSDELQLGGGVDLSYVLLNKERISTISVGVTAGEELKDGSRVVRETKPEIQFAYTLSMGF